MMRKYFATLLIAFCFSPQLAQAQVAEYVFCVKSDTYETFKARVVFRGLDFGMNSAKQMVSNELKEVLKGEFSIKIFDESCECVECPQVEVNSANWRDNFKKEGGDIKSIWGSAVEVGDAVISGGKELWDNPGAFLMNRILGQDES